MVGLFGDSKLMCRGGLVSDVFSCLPSVVVVLLDRCARRGQVTFGSVGLGSLRVDV